MKQLENQLLDSLPMGVFAIDKEYKITFWNKWLIHTTHNRQESVLNKNLFRVFPEIEKRGFKEKYMHVFETGEIVVLSPQFHEYLIPVPLSVSFLDDSSQYMQQKVLLIPIFDNKNSVQSITTTIEDVTESVRTNYELKKSWNDLKESKDFLLNIFDNTPNHAIIVTGYNGKIISWNKGAEYLFGYKFEEVKNLLEIEDIFIDNEENNDEIIRYIRNIPKDGKTFLKELVGIKKDGTEFPVSFTISPWKIKDEYRGAIAVISDITEQKRLQEDLFHAQRMESIGTLAGGIAHDFNNILTGIIGNISLLKKKFKDDYRTYSTLDTMENISKRAADLIKRLLSFARKGKKFTPKGFVNIKEVVNNVSCLVSNTIDKKVKITENYNGELWMVKGDHAQIEQVIMNLLVNAKDSLKNGGKIEVLCGNEFIDENVDKEHFNIKSGHYVKVSVKDTGCGIKKENLNKIFEPFFSTKERGKGTGIGLAMSYGIVKDHGGYIYADSEENKGTTMTVFLPADNLFVEKIEKVEKVRHICNTGTVLVVDDEDFLRDLLGEILTELKYKVIFASNGKEAEDIYKQKHENIDAVILDFVMPELNGEETYHLLKKVNPQVKVLFSSGFYDEISNLENLKNDGFHFIPKPYSMDEISESLSKIM